MALTIKRSKDNRVVKCVLHRVADIPGGVTVKVANLGGDALFEGTPLCKGIDGTYDVVKTAQVVTDYTSGTSLDIAKGSHLKVGDKISPDGVNYASISAIDKSNAAKDVITLSAGFSVAITANTCLFLVTVTTEKHEATAKGSAATTDTTFKVLKGHKFEVGDIVAGKEASKFVGETITGIDRGNDVYDTITVESTLSAAIVDEDVIIAVKATGDVGATASKQKEYDVIAKQNEAVAIAGSNEDVVSGENLFVSALVIGVVRESNAPIVNNDMKASLKGIQYI